MNALIVKKGTHTRLYPEAETIVQTNCGVGKLVYATEDGWLGIQLDGEQRIDEYPIEQCVSMPSLTNRK